jgi:hypothetical protein
MILSQTTLRDTGNPMKLKLLRQVLVAALNTAMKKVVDSASRLYRCPNMAAFGLSAKEWTRLYASGA